MLAWRVSTTLAACRFKETRSARKRSKNGPLRRPLAIGDTMTTLGSSVHTIGNLLHTHDLYDHLRAVPPAIAPYADPLNFCSPRIAEPVGPWARGKLVGARERTSRRRPAPPAVSRLMQRDLHPRHPPWPHGWHVAPGPRQDVVGWERLLLFRRRARNAPDQVDQRRAGDGRDLAGQREAAPGIMLLAHHRAPQTESATCTSSPSHD